MPTITTRDGAESYYKDWGRGQPVVFSHGWPLTGEPLTAKLVRNSTLTVYSGFPHGMCSTHKDRINADLLRFLKS